VTKQSKSDTESSVSQKPHVDDITPVFVEGAAEIPRYDRWHTAGNATFFLDDYSLNIEECKYLLMKLVEQAVRDYCSLQWADVPYRDFHWHTARDFLFDDSYFIAWGEIELNLEMIGELTEMDVDWIRRKAKERYKLSIEKRERKLKRKNASKKR
jgi:hypothetical protein